MEELAPYTVDMSPHERERELMYNDLMKIEAKCKAGLKITDTRQLIQLLRDISLGTAHYLGR